MSVELSEQEWQDHIADRRRLIGEARVMRKLLTQLMSSVAFHHAATAPQEPFWEFAGITEKQYLWWLGDLCEGGEAHHQPTPEDY